MSRERPIIMSGESVRAVLDGRKTQTRRVLKSPQPLDVIAEPMVNGRRRTWCALTRRDPPGGTVMRCRFGEVGDSLWVRETWANGVAVIYRADCVRDDSGEGDGWWRGDMFIPNPVRWRSPIHMPRWASRLTLEITGVRVERVNDISEADAVAEGYGASSRDMTEFEGRSIGDGHTIHGATEWHSAAGNFALAWEALNAKRGYGEAENPWVWVIEFRRPSSGEPAPQ